LNWRRCGEADPREAAVEKPRKNPFGAKTRRSRARPCRHRETGRSSNEPRVCPLPPRTAPRVTDPGAPDEQAGSGFAVQIAALNVRGEAEAIAKRLSSKGYMAYVLMPSRRDARGLPRADWQVPDADEAETVAAKLKKEEQFNPWVTR
jgi:cell division septation protein DedD